MSRRRFREILSVSLSPILAAALLIGLGATSAHASSAEVIGALPNESECGDSFWVTGAEELKRLWEEFGVTLVGDEGTTGVGEIQSAQKNTATVSMQFDENFGVRVCFTGGVLPRARECGEEATEQARKYILTPHNGESRSFWNELGDFWHQMYELMAEFPNMTLREIKSIWDQIEDLRAEAPSLSFEEARESWRQIIHVQSQIQELSFEEAKVAWSQILVTQNEMAGLSADEASEVWQLVVLLMQEVTRVCLEDVSFVQEHASTLRERDPEISYLDALLLAMLCAKSRRTFVRYIIQPKCTTLPVVLKDSLNPLPQLPGHMVSFLPEASEIPEIFNQRARGLLSSHGFEDTKVDGQLNWPKGAPFEGQDPDVALVVSEGVGVAIAFFPEAGDTHDGAALVLGRDPISGECPSQEELILLAISIVHVLPDSGRTLKIVWKQPDSTLPLLKQTIVNSNPGLSAKVRQRLLEGLVDDAYRGTRPIAGEGAITTHELAAKLELDSFEVHNYRSALAKFTGVSDEAIEGLKAHHILPKEFEFLFVGRGIETIHDPRLLVWVDESDHSRWSFDYIGAWWHFFEQNRKPNQAAVPGKGAGTRRRIRLRSVIRD